MPLTPRLRQHALLHHHDGHPQIGTPVRIGNAAKARHIKRQVTKACEVIERSKKRAAADAK
jgi:hypothetical protein